MRQNLKGGGVLYQKKGTKTKKSEGRELKVTGNKAKCTCKGGEGGYTRNGNEDRKSRGGGREVSCEKKSRGVIIYLFFFNFSVLL